MFKFIKDNVFIVEINFFLWAFIVGINWKLYMKKLYIYDRVLHAEFPREWHIEDLAKIGSGAEMCKISNRI